MPAIANLEQLKKAGELRQLLAAYTRSEDLLRIGAYQKGSDPTLDRAIEVLPRLHAFLQQRAGEASSYGEALERLRALPS